MDQRNIHADEDALKAITKQMLELSRQTRNYYRSLSSVGEVLSSIGKTVHNIFESQVEKQSLKAVSDKITELQDIRHKLKEDLNKELIKNVVNESDKAKVEELLDKAAKAYQKRKLGDPEDLNKFLMDNAGSGKSKEKLIQEYKLKNFKDYRDILYDISKLTGVAKDNIDIKVQDLSTKTARITDNINDLEKIQQQFLAKISSLESQFMELPNYIVQFALKYFEEMDRGMANYRRSMGLMIKDSKSEELQIRKMSEQYAHMGATVNDVVSAKTALNSQLTSIVGKNDVLVAKTIQLNKQFGISNDLTAKFFKTLAGVSGSTTKSQVNMIGFTKAMANAAGIPLDHMMSDIANASDDVRLFMGQTEISLIKAAASAAQLGLTMNDMASTARNMLQFESSITAELKASALIGKNIDFNEARRLAFQKDTKGMMEEIRRISKEVEFNKLNVIQQQAFAQATGLSVEKLQTMMQREKDLQDIRLHGTAEQKEQLRNLERMQSMREDEAKSQAARLTKELDSMANQERMLQLQDAWNRMMKELVGPLIDKLLIPLMNIAVDLLPTIFKIIKVGLIPLGAIVMHFATIGILLEKSGKHVKIFSGSLSLVGKILEGTILKPFITIGNYFRKTAAALHTVNQVATKTGKPIANIAKSASKFMKIGSGILRFTSGIGKFIPVVGTAITVITTVVDLIKNWDKIMAAFDKSGWEGFKMLGKVILDSLLAPFKWAIDWISSWFVGKSPSKLGLGIVAGLKAVGSLIIEALTFPFRTWYNISTTIFRNALKFFTSIIPNWLKKLFGASDTTTPSVTISGPSDNKSPKSSGSTNPDRNKPTSAVFNDSTEKMLQYTKENNELLNNLNKVLNNLNDLLISGNIGININGEKLNSELSNVRANFGEYGKVSKI